MFDINNNKENFYAVLAQGDAGRTYLKSALEKGREQDVISALHNLIDAILWDLSKQEKEQ